MADNRTQKFRYGRPALLQVTASTMQMVLHHFRKCFCCVVRLVLNLRSSFFSFCTSWSHTLCFHSWLQSTVSIMTPKFHYTLAITDLKYHFCQPNTALSPFSTYCISSYPIPYDNRVPLLLEALPYVYFLYKGYF